MGPNNVNKVSVSRNVIMTRSNLFFHDVKQFVLE